ncbi:hypothetical protein J1902_04340 [Arthrobacter sp. PO-11]|uniref:Putative Flp pilus-assembly TadG-like N-terminal domain-containing protein n=1 Tax=Arthrobacter cavernae TaxID=2817681 RepID=A0A939HCC7_9MICC|nr:hypothetical protein [Arthrobacter cavernae]
MLIGAGAMAVDVGQIYAERAELQNGADAGALAAAQLCASDSGCTQAGADGVAKGLADQNAKDGLSNVRSVDLSVAGQVTVSTSTIDGTTHAGFLSKMFASALSAPAVSVGAKATAKWGGPLLGPASLPIIFAPCQIDRNTGRQYLYIKDDPRAGTCKGDASTGHVTDLPGGFQFADPNPSGDCAAKVLPGPPGAGYIESKTGVSVPKPCKGKTLDDYLGKVVLLPVYSGVAGNGSDGKYIIEGFVAFLLEGFRFNGGIEGGATIPGGSSSRGIAGVFVDWVADPSLYSGGGYIEGGVTMPPELIK